ncbi:MAG: SH3 domain-containing protein [Deltaproteobacteria bacterium]|nr:SH3 domain-containing protein [Deltaproteobacteria bacterium]TLN04680.1 MAG: SH3 domain-containing protein [bacterium]
MSRMHISRNFGRSGSALLVALASVVLFFYSSVQAASERPRAGIGILFLRPAFTEQGDELTKLALYKSPGIEQIAQVNAAHLPSVSLSVAVPSGVFPVAATGKRGDWYRLAYDDAGREGWIEGRRFWEFYLWPDFLPGRVVNLLPNLRASYSKVHQEPRESSPALGSITPGQKLSVIEIRGRWALIRSEDGTRGWLRWCDGNGKLVILVEG